MDWIDGRAAGGGGSCSLALAKAWVTPAVSCDGIEPGGTGIGSRASRAVRTPDTDFTCAAATVTGGGSGGAAGADTVNGTWVAGGVRLAVSTTPRCGAKATARATSNNRVSLLYTSPTLRARPALS